MAEPMKNANEIRGVLDGGRLQFRTGGKWIDAGGDADTWLVLLVCAGTRDGAYRIKPDGVPAGAPLNWQDTAQGQKLEAAAARQLGLSAYTDEELAAEALRRISDDNRELLEKMGVATSGVPGTLNDQPKEPK